MLALVGSGAGAGAGELAALAGAVGAALAGATPLGGWLVVAAPLLAPFLAAPAGAAALILLDRRVTYPWWVDDWAYSDIEDADELRRRTQRRPRRRRRRWQK
ncbi:MAG: hypothetical protein ABEJ94_06780 [Halorientalis sp.]